MNEAMETFQQLLSQAVENHASDIHIKQDSPVSLRIDSKMVPVDFVPDKAFLEAVMHSMADDRKIETYEKTGDMDLSYAFDGARFRVNAHRQRGLHAMTLRHVKSKIFKFEDLGLPPVMEKIAMAQRGIILICGTTGSGKSTTLAAMLNYINKRAPKHIITIEDPIEYEFYDDMSFFEQREVGIDCDTFYGALVHALRQDPDIIMVGEMRDKESFEAAIQAADTGHLVLSTVHAASASQVIGRILDLYPQNERDAVLSSLAENLYAVVAQRLLPKALGSGVVPIIEVMIATPVVKGHLANHEIEKLQDDIEAGVEDGMQTFNHSLLERINNGEITEDVGMEASSAPEALRMNLKGIFLAGQKKG